ncbi:stabilizer of axonemal microtubules 1 [Gadus morhua]|uniref:stabilizer of axonemal microtubules 1 n=1 Tax=Gadus morhua TaxID=8049 RepID=UPI0011B76A2E|nr:stabilizer of axonemal microtubules 1-like [Gadus morhua]
MKSSPQTSTRSGTLEGVSQLAGGSQGEAPRSGTRRSGTPRHRGSNRQPSDQSTGTRAHTPFETDERPPLKAGMASHSVYTEDFQAWDSPARAHPLRPRDNLRVNRALFATATTNRDSFCPPGPPVAAREGCRPAPPPREAPPFDSTADHSSQYRPPTVRPRRPPARPACHPPGPPLTGVHTSHTDSRGQPSGTARSLEPAAAWGRSPASFASTTEFRDQYRAWPLPARLQPQTREHRAPEGDMAPLLSTTRAHFGEHRGLQRPPGARPGREASVRSSPVRSTMKEDFRAWTTVRRPPVAPPPQELEWPWGPFARTTTARASYTPKAAQRSLSCKPRPRPLNTGPPMEKASVYRASFTAPRGPLRDGAPPRGHGGVMDVRIRDRRSADAISNEPA